MGTVTELPEPSPAVMIPHDFEEETHSYRNLETGGRILSVTQVLDSVGIVDYSNVPTEAMSKKSVLGSMAHKATRYIDAPNSELDWSTVDEVIEPYIHGWAEFCEDANFVPELVEFRGAVRLPQGEVGFMLDRMGRMRTPKGDISAILEIKCTCKEEQSWRIQLAAYELCLVKLGYKPHGSPTFKRAAVQLLPTQVNGKLYKTYPYDDPRDQNVFKWALALATWKWNHGYKL